MSSHKFRVPDVRNSLIVSTMGILTLITATSAKATIPPWLQHVIGASTIEAALFRTMQLPSVQALYPRPPKEAQTELARLITTAPDDAQLHAVRAQTDESALDFPAAESDWKLSVQHSKDPVNARLQLAAYYHRRLEVPQEIAALNDVAAAPAILEERFVDPAHQRSWNAYIRIFALINDQALPATQTSATFDGFVKRYPAEPAVYAQYLTWQLAQKDWPAAEALISRYRSAFPKDEIFPIRAQAVIDYRRGDIDQALAVYDKSFQPLWPASLVQSYLGLLDATHRQRAFVADARIRLAVHPDGPEGLNALARIFYYDQQAGRMDKAQQTLDAFRIARESRNGTWTPQDLYTLANLSASIHSYSEAARYNYALASSSGTLPNGESAAQSGLAALVDLLLTAPDQPIALGAGNLSLYRDIAMLDQGPGYWNGILSLWLNGTSPTSEYNSETAKAQSYFHRSKAAELLAQLDTKFPNAPQRAMLHAEIIRTYSNYVESEAVIAEGKTFLTAFPVSPDRIEMASLMADAYARQKNITAEFTLYDSLLTELASKTNGLPLTSGQPATPPAAEDPYNTAPALVTANADTDSTTTSTPNRAASVMQAASYELTAYAPHSATIPEATKYARILDRYVGRLVAEKQLAQALTVLRHQLDLNPNDPQLYERLANFLQQNNLSAQQEATYKLAVARFPNSGWYDKLARFYLRQRNRQAYIATTRQVTDIFAGTDLDDWFRHAGSLASFNTADRNASAQIALQLNLYAQKRFPHDLVFTRNLLSAYTALPTRNDAAYEDTLRHHWWESDALRAEFFAYLGRTGRIQTELAALNSPGAPSQSAPSIEVGPTNSNPAATREQAELQIWNSHFETAAPIMAFVAELYPADQTLGDTSISLFRSLAYLDSSTVSTARAAAIETRLISADPANPDRLATLGDLYAEATSTGGEDIATAAPGWRRIPALHPGTPAGYLTSATIFWDYFQFDDALAEITAARTRFRQPALFGYEAGAIAENRHDLPKAIAEYTAVATTPPDTPFFTASLNAALGALFKPPSDSADSNLQATTQSLFNPTEARARLLQLATHKATAELVDKATLQVAATNTPAALTLRADILTALKRTNEIAPLLEAALTRATTVDEAAAIGDLARSHSSPVNNDANLQQVSVSLTQPATVTRAYAASGAYALTAVYEHALLKQIALSADLVKKIELSYILSGSLESRNEIAGAAKIIDSVYQANPRILGVVRTTTDFYARTTQPPRAIATLLEASKAATPDLSRNFTLEAAQRANESNNTAQARALALQLLPQKPYDPQVLGIIATSYARANDDVGLKAFYTEQLVAVKTATLTPAERKSDTALLRHGLIPALTRSKDYEGTVAQYIALLSAYPEDSATAQEAALYALRYSRQPQLLDFLRTTVKQSPQDSRFAILLAQIDTTFDDLPAAVSAYGQAITIRKDRADLYTTRADLELRLGLTDPAQLEAAASDFQRLYILSYKDPSWMVRLAELRARQQRATDAVKALEFAYIAGQPVSPDRFFKVSAQLAQWNLLPQARTFAEQGIKLAGATLLTTPDSGGASTYARVVTRLGRADEALAALTTALRAAEGDSSFPSELAAQYVQAGMSASDIARDRQSYIQARRQTARQQCEQAIRTIGEVVQTNYTPEQKFAYAQTLDKLHATDASTALTAASSAGLAEVEAEWRKQLLLNAALPQDANAYHTLELRRLKLTELGNTLEVYAPRLRPENRSNILHLAADAYRGAGDEPNEIRVTRPLALGTEGGLLDRYLDLLLRHDRATLVALAGSNDNTIADAAANYAVAHATQAQALTAIGNRARRLPAVWGPATASLVLTNFASPTTTTAVATLPYFTQPLRYDDTIATRLAKPFSSARELTGDNWFFYASRFGIFLATVPKAAPLPDSEDYLRAELERAPSAVAAYLHLARNYTDTTNYVAAIAEYDHALELAPNNPAVHDEFAVVLYRAGKRDEATAHWRTALTLMAKRQTGETFFTAFRSVTQNLQQRSFFATLRPEVEAVPRAYLKINGSYRSNEVLQDIFTASATPADGLNLILSLSTAASDPEQVLGDLNNASWLPSAARQSILLHRLDLARSEPISDFNNPVRQIQLQLLESYMTQQQDTQAQSLIDSIPTKDRDLSAIQEARIVLAARAGGLVSLIGSYRAAPDTTPSLDILSSAASELDSTAKTDPTAARALREFLFDQKQLVHSLIPPDYLALAKSRIDTNDLPGALELLHRLSLQPPSPPMYYERNPNAYTNTDSAASLLESSKLYAEAIPFLTSLVQSVPWNSAYRLRLAEAQLKKPNPQGAAALMTDVAKDNLAPYETRLQAARDLATLNSTASELGSGELTLLATSANPSPAAARQPYFVAARIAAASASALAKPDRIALLSEALAIAPNGPAADRARLDLLLTFTAADSASATLALYEQIASVPHQAPVDSETEADGIAPPDESAEDTYAADTRNSSGPISFPSALVSPLDRPTQIRLAVLLASAFNRDHNTAQSLFYDQLAVNIDAQNPKPDPVVVKRLADYKATLVLDQKNAQRRPLIHADLDQPNQVRPRLTLADEIRAEAP